MRILLIKVPEIIFSGVDIEVEKQQYGEVLLPLGILHLGTNIVATDKNFEVRLLDLHLELNKIGLENKEVELYKIKPDSLMKPILEKEIETFDPDVVGISSIHNAYKDNFHLVAKLIKELDRSIITVAGGGYPSSHCAEVEEDKNFDYIIKGEGEIPFYNLLKLIEVKHCPSDKIFNRNKKEYIKNIDDLPMPDYSLLKMSDYLQFDVSSYAGKVGNAVNLVSSRGCPMDCIYCATHNIWDYGFRYRSAHKMIEEVIFLKDTYGVNTFLYVEDNFVFNKNRVKEFCELLIEKKLNISWYPTSVHVNSLDEEMIVLMKQSGCLSLGLAVECGSERVQRLVKKFLDINHLKRMREIARRENIIANGLFMLGFPGETIEEVKTTINLARELKLDWCAFAIATPLYGTKMYEICEEKGYFGERVDELARKGNINTEYFTREQIEELRNEANIRVNFLENHNFWNGDITKAFNWFYNISKKYPKHIICRYMLMRTYKKMGKIEEEKKERAAIDDLLKKDKVYYEAIFRKYDIDLEKAVNESKV